MSSGAYVGNNVDDVTDFFGITEASSEDDVVAYDMWLSMKRKLKGGKLSEADQATVTNRMAERRKLSAAKKKKKGDAAAVSRGRAEQPGSQGSCFSRASSV